MTTLAEATTPAADGTLVVREGWRQGRGAYGGLTIAAAIRAIEARVADPRRVVRSVTAELPGPTLPGSARFEVDILRAGSSLTLARAALHQGDAVTTHAVAVLAAPRAAHGFEWNERVRPDAPHWRTIEPVPAHVGGFPEFTQHFEARIVTGMPMSGGPAVTIGWVRARDPGAPRDAAYVAALVDAWYPGALVRARPRPLGTIAFTLELVGEVHGDAPLLYRGTVDVAGDGYFLETRELWTEDGRLVALNHQTFAVIA